MGDVELLVARLDDYQDFQMIGKKLKTPGARRGCRWGTAGQIFDEGDRVRVITQRTHAGLSRTPTSLWREVVNGNGRVLKEALGCTPEMPLLPRPRPTTLG